VLKFNYNAQFGQKQKQAMERKEDEEVE